MSLKLENLPVELFGALSELLLANEVCWLWLSGSKRLHYLLEHGVTCFNHLPAQRRAYLWPSFISRFKRLQTVSVSSHRLSSISELYYGVVLAAIPNSVTSLKLNFENGFLSLLQPPSMSMISSSDSLSLMPLSTMFPNLAHLNVLDRIETPKGEKDVLPSWEPILALPLLSLHLSLFKPFPTARLKHLSPTITSLSISPMKGEVESFPPHLVALSLRSFEGSLDISILPRTLRRFNIMCSPRSLLQCRNWPFELEILYFEHSGLRLSHSDILALPSTLLSLFISVYSLEFESLHDLPQKLMSLTINGKQALSTVSAEEWTQFEPKRLPPNLVYADINHLIFQTPIERLNTFPKGIRYSQKTCIKSLLNIDPFITGIADRMVNLQWHAPQLHIDWSFKNLKTLSFGESVPPAQVYLTLPLLPLLKHLTLARYIEDPSLALNRITSPYFSRLNVNCHPLSLCKWAVHWFQLVTHLNLTFDPTSDGKSASSIFPTSASIHLDESARNDILAMDNADWMPYNRFGGTRVKQNGIKIPILNWVLYSPFLPQSLKSIEFCKYMEDPSSLISTAKCDWPRRLKKITAFVSPLLWPSLPQGLETFNTYVESSSLVELAKNLERLPKLISFIYIEFLHFVNINAVRDLPIFQKLLQDRPNITFLHIGHVLMTMPRTSYIEPFPVALETTFGLAPSV